MNAHLIASFADELEKDAAVPKLLQRLWHSGAGRALAGGAAGAAGGALASPEDRLRGALLGGALGAGGGYVAPLLTRAGRKKAWEHTKYLGSKTKHELTGVGKAPIDPSLKGRAKKKALKELGDVQRLGLTSIPGTVKGMATKPLQTLKGAWQHAGWPGKAMAGVDIATGVPHIMDPTTQEGVGEKALGTLGSTTGYLLGGRMGMLGSSVLGGGLGYLGGRVGRLFGGGRGEGAGGVGRVAALERAARGPLTEAVPEVGRLVGPG